MAVQRKYERDIDLLLAEEFSVSPEFAPWFLGQTTNFKGASAQVVDVFVSKSDNTGESDLVVLFERDGGVRFALHIEDKINAPLQPGQAARYRIRGKKGVDDKEYSTFEVVLCAPGKYFQNHTGAGDFDSRISYESVSDCLLSIHKGDLRGRYRADFVAKAAAKSAKPWSRVNDEVTNEFWKVATEIAKDEFPDLAMKKRTFSKDSIWIHFRPNDMPSQPRRIYVSFRGDQGFMDLAFSSCQAHKFHPQVKAILTPEMHIEQTGKATVIRLQVDPFKIRKPDEDVLAKVRTAFQACVELIRFYRANRDVLNRAAANSLPEF
jgi:hypothetical protein